MNEQSTTDQMPAGPRPVDTGKLVWGLMFVAVGMIFLFDRVFWIDLHEVLRLWPLFLIAFGVLRVLFPGSGRCGRGSRLAGFWPILIGGIFLADTMDVIHLHDSWPLFVVGMGVLMVLRATGAGSHRKPAGH